MNEQLTLDEARQLVASMRRKGLLTITAGKPTKQRGTPRWTPTPFTCDQCGVTAMRSGPAQKRCPGECSRRANIAAVRQWHAQRGLRGKDLGSQDCDRCGVHFERRAKRQRFCSHACRLGRAEATTPAHS